MLTKVEHTMIKYAMTDVKSVLVGLSGGADSVALTHVLCMLSKKYGFKVYAAHVNHGLRGDTAERDEAFSGEFAKSMGVEFFSLKADIKAVAKEKSLSEELAGREVRYAYFNELCEKHKIDFIATAHHKNDNAETILMNFMRGSGIKGLCGIPFRRDNIIRPLLNCTRAEIEEYCKENNLEYVTDETNLEDVYTRNKIRNFLIPEIESKFNPSIVETITQNGSVIAEEEDFLNNEAEQAYKAVAKDNSIDIDGLLKLHKAIALRVIRKMTDNICGTQNISSVVIASVLKLAQKRKTGAGVDVARGIRVHIEYGKLIFGEKQISCGEFSYALEIGKETYIPELGYSVLVCETEEYKKDGSQYFSVPENSSLCIRNRRKGDKFRPDGMNGTKKLKEFMIDRKIPQRERDFVGILTVNDEIAWVIGHRRSADFKFNEKGIKIMVI